MRSLLLEIQDEAAFDLVSSFCVLQGKDLKVEILSRGYETLLHQALMDHLKDSMSNPQTDVEAFIGADLGAMTNSVYLAVASKKLVPASFAAAMKARVQAKAASDASKAAQASATAPAAAGGAKEASA